MAQDDIEDPPKYQPHGGWVTIAVAALGILGTLGSGALGYQSGALSVNKDYVHMAMRNLSDEKTSPEFRRWSVDVLNKLAPIPFDEELRDQLIINRYVTHAPPEALKSPCPNLLNEERGKEQRLPDAELAAKFILAYEECRGRHNNLIQWHDDLQKELDAAGISSLADDQGL